MLEDICEMAQSFKFRETDLNSMSDPNQVWGYREQMLKCFNCYGDINKCQTCEQCNGRSYVSMNHPLAVLFNDIFDKKLCNQSSIQNSSRQLHLYDSIIKQQSSEVDQKRILCQICKFQCDNNRIMTCQQCQLFYVCDKCVHQDNFSHQHFLVLKKSDSLQLKLCHSCKNSIQNCYSICRTCQSRGIKYQICAECADSQKYEHNSLHMLEPTFYFVQSSTKFQSECMYNEEQFQQYVQEVEQQKNKDFESQIQSKKREKTMDNQTKPMRTFLNDGLLHPINTSKENQSRIKMQYASLFNSVEELEQFKQKQQNNKIRSLKQQQLKKSLNIHENSFPENIKVKEDNQSKNLHQQQQQQMNMEQNQDLVSGYYCNICKIDSIPKIRYHCKICKDFDICQLCFLNKQDNHQHKSYESIEVRKKQKMRQKIQNLHQNIQKIKINKSYKSSKSCLNPT